MNDLIPIPASDVHTILDALGKLIERQEDEIHDFQRVIEDNRGTEDMFDMIEHHQTCPSQKLIRGKFVEKIFSSVQRLNEIPTVQFI
ncbi:hypothetical protein [uncultured Desulfobacter sp.]|uniref:hypothetical protein n=1 Tax=uncultured Desulfobacter sp. TaxID=240139 RepID=UPI0029F48942|nr:hypothetical protein [uncultured Desulfobacter sp.]